MIVESRRWPIPQEKHRAGPAGCKPRTSPKALAHSLPQPSLHTDELDPEDSEASNIKHPGQKEVLRNQDPCWNALCFILLSPHYCHDNTFVDVAICLFASPKRREFIGLCPPPTQSAPCYMNRSLGDLVSSPHLGSRGSTWNDFSFLVTLFKPTNLLWENPWTPHSA